MKGGKIGGLRKHSLYKTWDNMKRRCYSKNASNYERYGGRGITVCDEWLNSFPQFLSDMGEKPTPDHTLDRIDNSKGYSPDNCRWATQMEQQHNKRNTRTVTINNKEYSLRELSEEYGVKYDTLSTRWKKGIRDESILKPPNIMKSNCSKRRWSK